MTLLVPALDRGSAYEAIARQLDIPPGLAERARTEYQQLGEYLCQDPALRAFLPYVYPQGSFRLGTTIKPVNDRDDYDIDGVCRLWLLKVHLTQKQLKALVGDALKRSPRYRALLSEGRRCWTLTFPDGFHIDILPSIPDPDRSPNGLLITDRELFRWQTSNPVDYGEWFKVRQTVQFERERREVAKAMGAQIDDVPDHLVRTPLQRAVQLLKRHRDIMFQARPDDKPISIIVTTLAAHAYDNSANVEGAVRGIVERMPSFIERVDGVAWVRNPTNERENFADRWQPYPERERAFYTWHARLSANVDQVFKSAGGQELFSDLAVQFGRGVTERALRELGDATRTAREAGRLAMAFGAGTLTTGPTLASASRVPNHTFHGGDERER